MFYKQIRTCPYSSPDFYVCLPLIFHKKNEPCAYSCVLLYYKRISRTRFCVPNFALYFVENLDKPFGCSTVFASYIPKIWLRKIASHLKRRIFEIFFARRKQSYWTHDHDDEPKKAEKTILRRVRLILL